MSKKILLAAPVLSVVLVSLFLMFWKLDQVDFDVNEDIYVADGIGYLRGDPYIVPRHHLRKPHYPASPHPFFVPLITSSVFKLFGPSILAARAVPAVATVGTTIGIIILGSLLFNLQIGTAAGFIFTLFPLVVRWGRTAVLDPILGLELVGLMIVYSLILKKKGKLGILLSGIGGIGYGLALSTKLTGVFFFLPILLIFIWYAHLVSRKFLLLSFLAFLMGAGATFFLFNDPYSYYFGWTHFSDPKVRFVTPWVSLKFFTPVDYWFYFIVSLFGVVPFVILCYGMIHLIRIKRDQGENFVIVWLLSGIYLLLNPVHITGLSSEWAYLPLMVPISLLLGKLLFDISIGLKKKLGKNIFFLLLFLYGLSMIPEVLFYGLRFRQLPLPNHRRGRNVLLGNLAVTHLADKLNKEPKKVITLIYHKGVHLPLWLLRDNIVTEPRYHELAYYDYIVTDQQSLIAEAEKIGFTIVFHEKNPSETEIYLLKNSTSPLRPEAKEG